MVKADVIIIGAGFYGLELACFLVSTMGRQVIVLERESKAMQRASLKNQARVHGGYHYPLSLQTALSCQLNHDRFVKEFPSCIEQIDSYYAVATENSVITPTQFENFCERLGAPLSQAPRSVADSFDSARIASVYKVKESVFNADKVRDELLARCEALGVKIQYQSTVNEIKARRGGLVECHTEETVYSCETAFCAVYSQINDLLLHSKLPPLPLEIQYTEMALGDVPKSSWLHSSAVTVVCGPFFSLMPYPTSPFHTLSHVRYTPRRKWIEKSESDILARQAMVKGIEEMGTNVVPMQKDASTFLPELSGFKYQRSLYEMKALALQTRREEGRPIIFKRDHALKNFHVIVGAKIDNIYDIFDEVKQLITREAA